VIVKFRAERLWTEVAKVLCRQLPSWDGEENLLKKTIRTVGNLPR